MSKKQRYHTSTKKVRETALALGYTISITKNNHLRFDHPSGAVVFTSGSPSAPTATPNCIAQMKRKIRETASD